MPIAPIRRIRLAPAAFAALLLAPAATQASDFTFTVPVDIRSLEARASHVGVRCEVFPFVPAAAPGPVSGVRIGTGVAAISLTDGGFQGNVTVRFNAIGPLKDAKGYRCALYYLNANGEEVSIDGVGHRQGTPYTPDARGALGP
ncbi:MAG TPA: hypothetical protein VMN04_00325 [Thermoanaerobaculia bacterium]|nr:hypothetical protein [Thermoanaerobaculia bacterium]